MRDAVSCDGRLATPSDFESLFRTGLQNLFVKVCENVCWILGLPVRMRKSLE